ncbi:MAG: RIP metalloprotease RseP [Deltaproteobacteria bacterium RIFOXYD12_FULL_57_12]|nr:MAG: RIP metalloprotease RseP [Deltaproteobacteria bacterium RIFOXYD12_FULL_57_12]
MNTFFSFVIVLGLLIFVHEFGHFLWAKIFGVRVLKFSLGFGPRLFGKQFGETEYLLSAFPLGGYVKMFGEIPGEVEEASAQDAHRSFSGKPVWQRFIIVAGGPLFNLLFAAFLFVLIFSINGVPQPVDGTKIGGIGQDSPAAAAGLQVGDMITTIDGAKTITWEDVSERIRLSNGNPVHITVQRQEQTVEFVIQPTMSTMKNLFGEVVGERYMVGISRSDEVIYEKVPLSEALIAGVTQTWNWVYLTILGLVKIIQKVVPASELGGPILIAQMAGKQMEAGWLNFLYFMGVISVNLGVLNLLPIPILDGGHLVFFSVEAILRKPLSLRTIEMFQQVGLVLLGSLMVFVFYNDLMRIFG